MSLKRVIMHWTGGGNRPSREGLRAYHVLVDRSGGVHMGNNPPEANINTNHPYSPHTRNFNSGSIGIAMCGMHGARDHPFNLGKYPLTSEQLLVFAKEVADLCDTYNIPVDRKHCLTHAEVQPTHGIRQRWKWDITWIPGHDMNSVGDPIEIGDIIRDMVRKELDDDSTVPSQRPTPPQSKNIPSEMMRRGSRGPIVERIQRALGIPDDGIFGPQTERELTKWQRRNNLSADGIAGPETYRKLFG